MSENAEDIKAETASAAEATATSETEKPDALTVCPCCGQRTLHKPVKPNDMLVDHWLACMITGTPFSHTYPIYNGKLSITVTQLTPDTASAIERLSRIVEHLKDKHPDIEGVNLDQLRGMARTFISVSSISVSTATKTSTFEPQKVVLDVYEDLYAHNTDIFNDTDAETWIPVLQKCFKTITNPALTSAIPVNMIIAVVDTHSRLFDILTEAGFDKNFWSGIELA